MIMPPIMRSITSIDNAWLASCSPFRYIRMGKSVIFLSRWATGSRIRKRASLLWLLNWRLADWHDTSHYEPLERQSGICSFYCAKKWERKPPPVFMDGCSKNHFLWLGERCCQNGLFLWSRRCLLSAASLVWLEVEHQDFLLWRENLLNHGRIPDPQ